MWVEAGRYGGVTAAGVADQDGGVEQSHVVAVSQWVARRYPDLDATVVESWVVAEFAARRDARVRQFLPVLVARAVEDRIRHDDGSVPGGRGHARAG